MRFFLTAVLALSLLGVARAEDAKAYEPPKPTAEAQAAFDIMLAATEANDYESFISLADDKFKAALTREMFAQVSAQAAPQLKAGYEALFLTDLKQQGFRVSLWKLSFKNGGDDIVLRLAMKDGKVGGAWLN